jgi:hypothetical protein
VVAACTFSGVFWGMRRDGVRLGIDILGEEVIFFDQPVHLEPVVETVFVAGIMRAGVGSFLDVGNVF